MFSTIRPLFENKYIHTPPHAYGPGISVRKRKNKPAKFVKIATLTFQGLYAMIGHSASDCTVLCAEIPSCRTKS